MLPKVSPVSIGGRIDGRTVFLRSLKVSDALAEYAGWLNDPVVNQYLETRSVTLQNLREYIRSKNESDTAILLGIFCRESGKHIGNVKLEPIDRDKKVATMGLLIGDKMYWGRGIGTEVVNLATSYAFETLRIGEVNLGVISENKSAMRVYGKCNFIIDHIEKKAVDHDGVRYDQVWMKKCTS